MSAETGEMPIGVTPPGFPQLGPVPVGWQTGTAQAGPLQMIVLALHTQIGVLTFFLETPGALALGEALRKEALKPPRLEVPGGLVAPG